MNKPSLRHRARYHFDNAVSRGPGAFVLALAGVGIAAAFVITVVRIAVYSLPKGGVLPAVRGGFWNEVNAIFFGSNVPNGSIADKLVYFLTWFATISVSATIIGFITTRLTTRLASLKAGKSAVIATNHVLILGWSNRIFPIIEQLAIANRNQRKSTIVILSEKSIDFMENEIETRVESLGKTKVVLRSGDPTNPKNLTMANIASAKSVIALDDDSTGDAAIISTVLAIIAATGDVHIPVIAEIDDISHAHALSQATGGKVLTVNSNEIIARVTAQASRQPGLAAVFLDLLDFEGDEMYFQNAQQLVGGTYGDALVAFNKASVIGVRQADGQIRINPEADYKFRGGDQVIAIAEDDDKVIFSGWRRDLDSVRAPRSTNQRPKPEHLLFIGWSHMGRIVLDELAPFLARGSSVQVIADPALIKKEHMPPRSVAGVKVTFQADDGSVDELAGVAAKKHYDEIIVLAYREKISAEDADGRTLLTMLLLNRLFDEDGNGVERTRLVAEILNSRQAELAEVANADDLVVSDNLAALMATQLTENPELSPVFDDLFDADGASVNVQPAERYVAIGQTVTYATLVAAARNRGESAIGYLRGAKNNSQNKAGVELNPSKLETYKVQAGDALIVVGEI